MQSTTPTSTRPKLLVVDDSRLILQMVYDFFMAQGYRVDLADDGQAALEYLERQTPDVIVSDILMPGMDGWELFGKIREREATSETPFVFLTTEKELPERLRGFRIGADDYVTKPFEVEELHARVERILQFRRILDAARRGEGSMLAGSVEHLGLPDLLQMLAMNGKDAEVEVAQKNRNGWIRFRAGEIVHAEAGGVTGIKALYRMLGWEQAGFRVTEPTGEQGPRSVTGRVNNLVMDGMVSLDEWMRWKDGLPARKSVLRLADNAKKRLEGRKVSPAEFEVMARCKAGENVGRILDVSPQPDGALAGAICTLVKLGVLETSSDS
jgi:CheY-like chemotaxis protein